VTLAPINRKQSSSHHNLSTSAEGLPHAGESAASQSAQDENAEPVAALELEKAPTALIPTAAPASRDRSSGAPISATTTAPSVTSPNQQHAASQSTQATQLVSTAQGSISSASHAPPQVVFEPPTISHTAVFTAATSVAVTSTTTPEASALLSQATGPVSQAPPVTATPALATGAWGRPSPPPATPHPAPAKAPTTQSGVGHGVGAKIGAAVSMGDGREDAMGGAGGRTERNGAAAASDDSSDFRPSKLACEQCDFTFSQRYNLRRHMMDKHPEGRLSIKNNLIEIHK